MPSKGRKRRQERRSREHAGTATPSYPAVQPRTVSAVTSAAQPLPSKSARFTGLMIAVITAILSILLIAEAAGSGATSVDGVTRIVAGGLMVLIALVVGVLSVFPAQIARLVRARSQRSG
jgi:hypothetical protein